MRRGTPVLIAIGTAAAAFALQTTTDVVLRRAFRTRAPARGDGADVETVWVDAARSKRLAVRLLLPAGREPAGVVLIIHGWGGSSADMAAVGRALSDAGFGALLVDARCHGLSDDDDFASMPRFAEDIESALRWLGGVHGWSPSDVVLLGHSVGAGAALLAATRTPVAGVVAIACMAHPHEMMTAMMARRGLPAAATRYVLRRLQHLIGQPFDSFAPINTIGLQTRPVLLVHGDQDDVVPVGDAHRLLRAAQGDAALLVAPGAGHRSVEAFLDHAPQVVDFVARCLGSK